MLSTYVHTKGFSTKRIDYTINDWYVEFSIVEFDGGEYTAIDGSIKWDGCANFQSELHYCGSSEVQHWADIVRCCYYIASTEMPKWDDEQEEISWPKSCERSNT